MTMLSVSDASLRSIARRHGTEFVATILNHMFFGDTINGNRDTIDTVLPITSELDAVATGERRMQNPLRIYGSTPPRGRVALRGGDEIGSAYKHDARASVSGHPLACAACLYFRKSEE